MANTMLSEIREMRWWVILVYYLCMLFSFFAGNVFIDSYDVFVVRFLYPDADAVLIFLISLLVLIFLYTYFRSVLKASIFKSSTRTIFLIFTWFGFMGILLQNMLIPLNHFVSYVEIALIFFLLGALLLSQISERYKGKLKVDYMRFIIGLVMVNVLFVLIKKIVFEKLGTSGVNLVAEIDLLGATFNITSLLLVVFMAILGLMIWSTIKNFQIIASDIKDRKQLGLGNKNFLGIIVNQGAMLTALLGLVFVSFYFMKNQSALKDFLHYSFVANVNYYATMKWTYLSNLFFFVPFMAMFFYLDSSYEGETWQESAPATGPIYNFNMKMVLSKEDLEEIISKKT